MQGDKKEYSSNSIEVPDEPICSHATQAQEFLFEAWIACPTQRRYKSLLRWGRQRGTSAEATVRTVVKRHMALRTKLFTRSKSGLLQIFQARENEESLLCLATTHTDSLWTLPGETEVMFESCSNVSQFWDLVNGCLGGIINFVIVADNDNEAVFAAAHEIIMDESSLAIVKNELSVELAPCNGSLRPHQQSCLKWWEFAEWEKEIVHKKGDVLRTWWRQHLQHCQKVNFASLDGTWTNAVGHEETVFKALVVVRGTRTKAADVGGVHVSILWQGLFALWCWRHMEKDEASASSCFVITGPFARRNDARFQQTVGYLLNTLVYRYDGEALSTCADLEALARESGRVVAETVQHGAMYPFQALARDHGELCSGPDGKLRVMFAWVANIDTVKQQQAAHTLTAGNAKAQMSIACSGERLLAEVVGRANKNEAQVLGLSVLRGIVLLALSRQLSVVRLLQAVSEHALQEQEWGTGETLRALGSRTFQQLVRRAVRRSNTVLPLLPHTARGAGQVVALHMRRSELLARFIYSVVVSGAAFLPLDSAYNVSVVQYRIEDSSARSCFVDRFSDIPLSCDTMVAGFAQLQSCVQQGAAFCDGGQLAYLLYTSGSTGAPKGLAILQKNVVNFSQWCFTNAFQMSAHDVYLWQSSISFDMIIGTLFWTAQSGGRLCSITDGYETNSSYIYRAVQRSGTTMIFIVPSHLSALMLNGLTGDSVRHIMVGGEALSSRFAVSCSAAFERSIVVNFYGPTETTVGVTCFEIKERSQMHFEASVPIGKPFYNCMVKVRNGDQKVFISGAQVGAGYLNLTSKTRATFLYDYYESNNNGSENMYSCGDFATHTVCGDVIFLGRVDDQVKVNGQRVELGAVESAVLSCPQVSQCTVVVMGGDSTAGSSKWLAACVVLRDEYRATTSESDLRAQVSRRVARHEVPQRIVLVDRIPLTAAGKADRQELKKVVVAAAATTTGPDLHSADRADITSSTSAPTLSAPAREYTLDVQNVVRQCMAGALGMPVASFDASRTFWENGGTSLMAMALDAALQRETGARIGMAQLMRDASLEGISRIITKAMPKLSRQSSPTNNDLRRTSSSPNSMRQQSFHVGGTFFGRTTFGQEGLFVIWKIDTGAHNYDTGFKMTCDSAGCCDVDHEFYVRSAIQRVVEIHPALQTSSFVETTEGLLQKINRLAAAFAFEWLGTVTRSRSEKDKGYCPKENEADCIRSFSESIHEKPLCSQNTDPWDLMGGTAGGIVRFTSWRGQELQDVDSINKCCFSIEFLAHHIVTDEWSLNILKRDLKNAFLPTALYDRTSFVEASDGQCWDFAEWERTVFMDQGYELRTWWKRHLRDCSPIKLRTHSNVQGARQESCVEEECTLHNNVKISANHAATTANVSLFSVWQGLFALWCWRHMEKDEASASSCFVITGPFARRNDARFQQTVGYLLNTLVYRYDGEALSTCADLEALARESGRVVAETVQHGAMYPFQALARDHGELCSGPDGKLRVMFAWVANIDAVKQQQAAHTLTAGNAKAQMSIACSGEKLLAEVVGRANKNEAQALGLSVLRGIVLLALSRQLPVVRLLQAVSEHALQEQEWGTGESLRALGSRTFQQLVRRAVRRSNTVLPLLPHTARGAGQVVALHMRRSELLARFIYSVVASGAAFLPLDSAYNVSVVQYRIEDSLAVFCYIESNFLTFLKHLRNSCEGCVGSWSPQYVFTEEVFVQADAAAYIMHTSGSTGNPKGVKVLQRNVPNLLQWCNHCDFQMIQRDVFLWQSSVSFDIFIVDLFWTVEAGAIICAVSDGLEIRAQEMERIILQFRVSLIFGVPSYVATVFRPSIESFASVRLILMAGEALSVDLSRHFEGRTMELWNAFGPTETTVVVSFFNKSKEFPLKGLSSVPIGKPFSNNFLRIKQGFLYLGGEQVSDGYLNMPAKSKEKFFYDESNNDGTSKTYDCGDRVAFLQSGNVQYLGRADDQVKVSGQRVELGAVESALLSCPQVSQCTVVVMGGDSTAGSSKWLAACVVLRDEYHATTSESDMRAQVSRRVARHEVPQRIVLVDRIPLTTAGKADRQELKKIVVATATSTPTSSAPAREYTLDVQNVVRQCMAGALGMPVASFDASRTFWENGGTSLMAMALDAALQRETGARIGMAQLMRDASLEGIVRAVNADQQLHLLLKEPMQEYPAESKALAALKLPPQFQGKRIKLSSSVLGRTTFGQEGLYVIWKADPAARNYDTGFDVLHTTTFDDVHNSSKSSCRNCESNVQKALQTLVTQHAALQTHMFIESSEGVLQKIDFDRSCALSWQWFARNGDADVHSQLWPSHLVFQSDGREFERDLGGNVHEFGEDALADSWDLTGGRKGGIVRFLVGGCTFSDRQLRQLYDRNEKQHASIKLERSKEQRKDCCRVHIRFLAHHIVTDEWSITVLKRDLKMALLYLDSNRHGQLKHNANFGGDGECWDFAEWERKVVLDSGEEMRAWWTEHLRGCKPFVPQGIDKNGVGLGHTIASLKCAVPQVVAARARQVATAAGVSLFAVWQGFFAFWCMKTAVNHVAEHSEQGEYNSVVITGPVARRNDAVFQNTVGYFVNMVIFAYKFDALQSCHTLEDLSRVSSNVMSNALEHGSFFPIQVLMRCLSQDIDALTSMSFAWVDRVPEIVAPSIRAKSKFPMSVFHDGSQVCAEASSRRVCLEVVHGFCLAAANVSYENVRQFSPRMQAEEVLQITEWNSHASDMSLRLSLQEHVHWCVAAVSQRKTIIVLPLINYLIDISAQRNVCAVYMKRSEMLICVILTIASSGSAFLPIDKAYNFQVLCYRLQDSAAVICFRDNVPDTVAEHSLAGICVSSLVSVGHKKTLVSMNKSAIKARANDRAYVLYTSGSTGNPKGVIICQSNVMNLLLWFFLGQFQMSPHDVFLFQSSISFDPLILQIFGALTTRASTCVVPDECEKSASYLTRLIEMEQVSVILTVPSFSHFLYEYCRFCSLSLRLLMIGGEALQARFAQQVRTGFEQSRVWNVFGPTETTVILSWYDTGKINGKSLHHETVPIGKPFCNTSLFVKSSSLFLAGSSIGAGYVNLASKTREKFLYNTWYNDGSSMMYNSGDHAAVLETGDVQYLGRADDQVKVRGQRVELGAVESALLSIAEVAQCTVVAMGGNEAAGTNKWLAACVVVRPGHEDKVNESDLRAVLARKVAPHEVPQRIVFMDQLPLTTAGKADRQTLKRIVLNKIAPETRASPEAGTSNPEENLTDVIVKCMASALGISPTSYNSSRTFWENGGTSLMAMTLDATLQRETGVQIGLAQLMRDASVSAIAHLVTQRIDDQMAHTKLRETVLTNCKNVETQSDSFRLTPAVGRASVGQEGLYVIWKTDPVARNYDTQVQVMINRQNDVAEVQAAMRQVVMRHAALRTRRFLETAEGLLQCFENDVGRLSDVVGWWDTVFSLRVEDNFDIHDASAALVRSTPWDLAGGSCGGVVRLAVVEVVDSIYAENLTLLTFAAHHIVTDEWSIQILERELKASLSGAKGAAEPSVKVTGCWEFAEWENEVLRSRGRELRDWWVQHLRGCRSRVIGSEGQSDGPIKYECISSGCTVPTDVVEITKRTASATNVSLFSVWQGLFALWCSRKVRASSIGPEFGLQEQEETTTRTQYVLITGPYARRSDGRFQDTVGYLLNMLVYRYDCDKLFACANAQELARESGRIVAETVQHGAMYPFQLLLRDSNILHNGRLSVSFAWVSRIKREPIALKTMDARDAKADLDVACDGQTIVVEAVGETAEALAMVHDVSRSMLQSCRAFSATLFNKLTPTAASLERTRQGEEWSAGETSRAFGSKTFQQLVGRAVRRSNTVLPLLPHMARGAGQVVALHMRRSELLARFIYSVVASGAAFLPLDSAYSTTIVQYRLNDSESVACVADLVLAVSFRETHVLCPVLIGALFNCRRRLSSCVSHAFSFDTGYVFYTSGSTGSPKGVLISQGNAINYGRWWNSLSHQLCEQDTALWQSSVSFDQMLKSLFCAVIFKSKICVLSEGLETDLKLVQAVAMSAAISVISCVPSYLHAIGTALPETLRLAFCGGESLSMIVLRKCEELLSRLRIWNCYGPTEATVNVAAFNTVLRRKDDRSVAIGRPFCNTTLVVSKSNLLIHGESVGLGYKNLKKATKRAFVIDTMINDGLKHLYLTGDKAEVALSGNIQYLGRADDQVKVNGQRVELGAVESAVLSCPQVSQCTVVVMGGDSTAGSSKWLAACVVLRDEYRATTSESDLRAQVSRRVARHEVPQRIVLVDRIPLTTAGKADRSALRDLVVRVPFRPSELKSANSKEQTRHIVVGLLSGMFSGHYNDSKNFWENGGTSLMGMRLTEMLQREFGVFVTLTQLLKDSSVDSLCELVEATTALAKEVPSSPVEKEVSSSKIFKEDHGFVRAHREFSDHNRDICVFFVSAGVPRENQVQPIFLLQEKFSVVYFEFAGLAMGPAEIARILFALLTETEVARITTVFGHCIGGIFAFEFAKMFDRPMKLILSDSASDVFVSKFSNEDDLSETLAKVFGSKATQDKFFEAVEGIGRKVVEEAALHVYKFFTFYSVKMLGEEEEANQVVFSRNMLEAVLSSAMRKHGRASSEADSFARAITSVQNAVMWKSLEKWEPSKAFNVSALGFAVSDEYEGVWKDVLSDFKFTLVPRVEGPFWIAHFQCLIFAVKQLVNHGLVVQDDAFVSE